MAEAWEAIDAVAPAIEIIDSRYKNFRFSLADVVADNASSSGYVLGRWQSIPESLDNLGMVLYVNGEPVEVAVQRPLWVIHCYHWLPQPGSHQKPV